MYIRATATLTAEHQTSLDLTVFRVRIEGVKEDLSTSAEVISGITLRLRDPAALASVLLEQSAFRGLMHHPRCRHNPGLQIPRLRYSPGLAPTTRLNALLNAAPDS
jgi:hypothetical protein